MPLKDDGRILRWVQVDEWIAIFLINTVKKT